MKNKKTKYFMITFYMLVVDAVLTFISICKYGIEAESSVLMRFLFGLSPNLSFYLIIPIGFLFYSLIWDLIFFLECRYKKLNNLSISLLVLLIGMYMMVYTQHIYGYFVRYCYG
jgi:hypothetical protein